MNPSTVAIHEFSTGINPQKTVDGGWVSLGFTGKYMNATIDPIPSVVERAIANREFAVTEKASSDQPAIIGRVLGSEEQAWSVVAVVTRGQDEKGRSISVYRYFLCQGANHLWKILVWLESQGMPRFNPFDTRAIGQPNLYVASGQSLGSSTPDLSSNTSEPILLSPGQYNVQDLNRLAIRKANKSNNSQPVSWAFNVEALEQPRRFQVIQPASDRAFRILENAIANAPRVATPIGADEQAIKTAIKSLMKNSQVKLEALQALTETLGNNKMTSEYWHSLFDGQGAKKALDQKIHSDQMVRLVTLRAIVIPETLPKYLSWMQELDAQSNHYQISEKFQAEIRQSLKGIPDIAPYLFHRVSQGVKLIIPCLLTDKELLESVVWLLKHPQGLWGSVFTQQVIPDINHDLSLMSRFYRGQPNLAFKMSDNQQWKNIWKELKKYWQTNYSRVQEEYQSLAKLFAQFNCPEISAFFYHVACGEVPEKIFRQLPGNGNFECRVYEVNLKKEITLIDYFKDIIIVVYDFFKMELRLNVFFVFVIMLVSYMAGFFTENFAEYAQGFLPWTQQKTSDTNEQKNDQGLSPPVASSPSPTNTGQPNQSLAPEMPPEKKEQALAQFEQTRQLILQIMNQLKADGELKNLLPQDNKLENKIKQAFKDVLLNQDLNYAGAILGEGKPEDRKYAEIQWVEAIYAYQKKEKPDNAAGFILPNGLTYPKLKQDIKNHIKKSTPQPVQKPDGR